MPSKLILPLIILLFVIGIYFLSQPSMQLSKIQDSSALQSPTPQVTKPPSGTAKGVVFLEKPSPKDKITSPLVVSGTVQSKKGKLTITLKQKESGSVVTQPKVVQIQGESVTNKFAETLQFGLPVKPQTGILEIDFKDESGKNADDKFTIEVEFPSDLGSGK